MKRLHKITSEVISFSTRKAGKLSVVHRLYILAVIIAALTFTFCEDIMEQVKEYNESFRVVSVEPANNASDVDYTTAIAVIFSNDVDMSTVSSSTFKVNNGAVTGTFSYNPVSRQVTFTPDSEFLHNTVYSVNITEGLFSIDGKPLESPYSWSFTTTQYYFSVITVTPFAGEPGVPLNTNIVVQFNDNIDAATLISANFYINSGAVAGVISYDPLLRTATFNPAADLTASTNYTVTLTTGVKNLTGESVISDYSWSFITGAAAFPEIYILSPFSTEIFSGDTFNFGSIITPYTFTIGNSSGSPLSITMVTLSDMVNFNTSLTAPSSVGALSSNTFTITFTPGSTGTKTATLTIANDDADENPFIINLTGVSLIAPAPEIQVVSGGVILVSPNSTIDFGTIAIGANLSKAVTMYNIGSANLVISNFSFGGSNPAYFSTDFGVTPVTILPGATKTFNITFSAPVKINARATITFTNNDSDEGTFVVKLKGRTMP